jgi:hypothetical protein
MYVITLKGFDPVREIESCSSTENDVRICETFNAGSIAVFCAIVQTPDAVSVTNSLSNIARLLGDGNQTVPNFDSPAMDIDRGAVCSTLVVSILPS